jgi:competence protein ComEC
VSGDWAPLGPFGQGWLIVVLLVATVGSLRSHSVITLLLLCSLCFCVGWWRADSAMQHRDDQRALHLRQVRIVGRAMDEAVYGKQRQLEFVLTEVRLVEPYAMRLVGNVTVRGFGQPMIYRGDMVAASGSFYPTRGNSVASISFAELEVIDHDDSWLNNLRRKFAAGMQSALPEPAASFALGLLIGQRTTLPEAVSEQLRAVGLTHIIAVSGYNLTVIVMACRRMFAARSKFQATAACVLLIMTFLLITGTSPPVVRAGIISMIGLAAWYYGHEFKPGVLLLLGAAITVLANPFYLWGNVSWYLSFLAFYGVLVLAPLVCKRIWGIKEPRMLGALVVESACASIVVLPYILFIFGETSLVSLLANMLVVPGIPLAMLLGLAGGLGGMFVPRLAGWFAWPARWLLTYMLDVANLLSRVPFAFVEDITFSLAAMITAYAGLLLLTVVLWHKTRHIDQLRRQHGAETM